MSIEDFRKVLVILKNAYPSYFKNMSSTEKNEFISVWHSFFKDEELETVLKSVQRIILKSEFMPSISGIKKEITTIKNPSLKLNVEFEWENVIKAIRKYGSYKQKEAIGTFNVATRAVVQSLGWERLCGSTYEQLKWLKKDFIEIFENKQDSYEESLILAEPKYTIAELARISEEKMLGKREL